MRRWHAETQIAYRNWRNHRRLHIKSNLDNPYPDGIGRDPFEVDCECDNQIGRFRKKDAFDCGRSMCIYCHHGKWLLNGGHEITRQEIKAHIKLKEGIKELENGRCNSC